MKRINERKKGQQDDQDGDAGPADFLHGVEHEVRAAADPTNLAPRRGGDVAEKGEDEGLHFRHPLLSLKVLQGKNKRLTTSEFRGVSSGD